MTMTRMDDVDALSRVAGGASLDMMSRMFSQYTRGTYQLDRWTQQYLYRNYGILKKLVNIAPNQMTFRWGHLQLGGKDGDADVRNDFDRLTRLMPVETMYSRKRGLSTAFNLAQKAANKTGDGAILLDVDDGGGLDEPINLNRLKRINRLFVLNRWSIKPLIVGSMYDQDFYQLGSVAATRMLPELRKTAFQTIHRSRILWFRGEELDDEELMRTGGCDDSVFQSILKSFFNYQDAVCGAKEMIQDFDIFVHSLEGLLEELENDGDHEYEKTLSRRIEANDDMRRVHRTQLIDKDKEAIAHSTRQVSGYSDLMDRVLDDFLANVELTPSELLGKYPKGMADTGKTEQQNANDRTSRYQAEKFYSNVMDFCELFFRCKEGPTKGKVPDSYNFIFAALYPVTPPEQAELQLNYAQIDDINIRNQVYSGEDVAKSRYGGNEFQTNIIIDFKKREQDQAAAAKSEQPPEDDIDALLKDYQTDSADLPRLLPPPEVQAAARQGLMLYKQQNIKSGLALTPLAQRMSMGYPIEPHDVQSLRVFFISPKNRKVSKQPPSEGFGAVMWLMMGGDVGDMWSGAIARELERRSDAIKAEHVALGVAAVGAVAAGAYLLNKSLEKGKQAGQKCGKSHISAAYECHAGGEEKLEQLRAADKALISPENREIMRFATSPEIIPLEKEEEFDVGHYIGQRLEDIDPSTLFGKKVGRIEKIPGITRAEATGLGTYLDVGYPQMNKYFYDRPSMDTFRATESEVLATNKAAINALKRIPSITDDRIKQEISKLKGGDGAWQPGAPLLHHANITSTEGLQSIHDTYKKALNTGIDFPVEKFLSTTYLQSGLDTYKNQSNLEIRITPRVDGKGSGKLVDEFKNGRREYEVLYIPGSRFKVKNVIAEKTEKINRLTLELEEI